MLRRVDVDDGNEPCDDASYGLGGCIERTMGVTVVAARTNRVSPALPVIVSDGLNGYPLGGDGRRPLCHWDLLCDMPNVNQI